MIESFLMMVKEPNTQWVLFGTMLLGIASGVLGCIAFLRKQSLIGDAVAHAALPGICLAFMFTGEKLMFPLLIGAAISGLAAAYLIQFIVKSTIIKEDAAICLILSSFFGLGIVLLTKIAQMPSGDKSGLNDFIFGKAASMVGGDVRLMAGAAFCLIVLTFLLLKELKVMTFDPNFAKGLGLKTAAINFIFVTMLVIAIVIGIQAVGVILMAALLIIPAISARYWTDSLTVMVILSACFGALSGMAGTIISTFGEGLATGPFIVVFATAMFIFSMLFAPKRGLLTSFAKRVFRDRRLKEELQLYREGGKEYNEL